MNWKNSEAAIYSMEIKFEGKTIILNLFSVPRIDYYNNGTEYHEARYYCHHAYDSAGNNYTVSWNAYFSSEEWDAFLSTGEGSEMTAEMIRTPDSIYFQTSAAERFEE